MSNAPAVAFDLALPSGAQETAERITGPDSYRAPKAAFDGDAVPRLTVEGTVARRAWRIPVPGLTPLQIVQPLRGQLEAQGYDIVFECENADCGGFDFRFGIEVLPGPNMYVNIGRYRFLTALRGTSDAPKDVVTVLASVTTASGYVQIIHADTEGAPAPDLDLTGQPAIRGPATLSGELPSGAPDAATVRQALEQRGAVVLAGLAFDTGSKDLGPGPFPWLSALGEVLAEEPGWRVALVGHTDTVGGLGPNIALSKARATSVRDRLIEGFGIAPDRLEAEGMGYLAPVAANRTSDGRARNRRVEAILLNTE